VIRRKWGPIPLVGPGRGRCLNSNFLRLPADLAIQTALGDRVGAITATFSPEDNLAVAE